MKKISFSPSKRKADENHTLLWILNTIIGIFSIYIMLFISLLGFVLHNCAK